MAVADQARASAPRPRAAHHQRDGRDRDGGFADAGAGRDRALRALRPGATKDLNIPLAPSPTAPLRSPPGGLIGAVVNRQPVGAVACISPYNFPLVNMAGKIAPALAVGCTVVMKPAPQDPLAILELAEIMHEVGFPPGVVNVITSSRPGAVGRADRDARHRHGRASPGRPAVGEAIYRGRRHRR